MKFLWYRWFDEGPFPFPGHFPVSKNLSLCQTPTHHFRDELVDVVNTQVSGHRVGFISLCPLPYPEG